MRKRKPRTKLLIGAISCLAVLAILSVTGILANIVRALDAYFRTTTPNKTLTINPGGHVLDASEVEVYDENATTGYSIAARLNSDINPDFTVKISEASSTTCPSATPCTLTTTDQYIYFNMTDSATDGDLIDFDVDIRSSTGLAIPENDIEIIYTKRQAYLHLMQTFSAETCTDMSYYPNTYSEFDLVDVRDGKTYKVRKLLDGKCWMVDNLALANMTLNSTTSDMSSGTYALSGVLTDVNRQTYCAGLDTTTYPYQCGYYYTWTRATTGSNLATGDAPKSICPKGWQLPIREQYTYLVPEMDWSTSNDVVNSGWRGLLGGYTNGTGTYTGLGTNGYYWTANAVTSGNAAAFPLSSFTSGFYALSKELYLPIRCVLR